MDNLPPLLPRCAHGGPSDAAFSGVDFSVNSNPFGPNPTLLAAVRDADHAPYPDPSYRLVREKLARWHGVSAQEVTLSVGASDLLHRAARAFLPAGRTLLSLYAPFGELERAARLQRAEVQVVREIPAALPQNTRLVYVGHPHNPTGRTLSAGELLPLANACSAAGALLILDLAYAPFLGLPLPPLPSTIYLHSPGKAHGLVGARPAYAISEPHIIARLENLAPAWHVPAGTAALLHALPDAQAFLSETLPRVRELGHDLALKLAQFGPLEHHGTPYLTLQVGDAAHVTRHLLRLGIRVRGCASYGLPEHIRVSTRTAPENARLIHALREVTRG